MTRAVSGRRESKGDSQVRTEQNKLYPLVAIDRTLKFALVERHEKATRRVAGDFLRHLAAAVSYRIDTVLTGNGTHFTDPTGDGWTPEDIREMRAHKLPFRCHSFELVCADLNIEHRLTRPRHPWTNGQVERMNRTIREAVVQHYHYETHDQLRRQLTDFVVAYDFARRPKTLRGLTPYEAIGKAWTDETDRFVLNPYRQSRGLTSNRRFQREIGVPSLELKWRRRSPSNWAYNILKNRDFYQCGVHDTMSYTMAKKSTLFRPWGRTRIGTMRRGSHQFDYQQSMSHDQSRLAFH